LLKLPAKFSGEEDVQTISSSPPCLKPLDLNQSDEAILASIATETVLSLEIPF
jgi:hypothetical protein